MVSTAYVATDTAMWMPIQPLLSEISPNGRPGARSHTVAMMPSSSMYGAISGIRRQPWRVVTAVTA